MAAHPGSAKRQREIKRDQKAKEKAERREQRRKEKESKTERGEGAEDPDIAGIVPGPQPIPDEET